jgi:hypothetical protein
LRVLGFELGASCLLSRCSTAWVTPPAFQFLLHIKIHCNIYIGAYNISLLDLPPPELFYLCPILRTISTGFSLLLSSMNTKYIQHNHPFIIPLPPTNAHLQKRPVLPSCPSFFKCILIAQGGFFSLVFQACMFYALIRFKPPHYLLFLYNHILYYSIVYGVLGYIICL